MIKMHARPVIFVVWYGLLEIHGVLYGQDGCIKNPIQPTPSFSIFSVWIKSA